MMKRWIIAIVLFAFGLSGCSNMESKSEAPVQKTVVEKKAEETASAKAEASAQSKQKEAEETKKKEVKPQSEVEVIPRQQAAQPEVTLEPLPEQKPAAAETSKTPESESAEPAPTPEAMGQASTGEATESGAPTAKEEAGKPKTKTVVEKASDKNVFVVTVGPKTPDHPFYGKGHSIGFIVDGVPGKELVLQRGKTYKFDVRTNPKHDLYISTKGIGWGSTAWTEGVQGMYTYKGVITFTPDKKTPDILYYSCRNHPFMGGKIHIVNPGQTVAIKRVTHKAVKTPPSTPTKTMITEKQAKQKILFAGMLMNSRTAKHVQESGMKDAISMQSQGQQLLMQARSKFKAGNHAGAYADADKALNMLRKASKMVPGESELQQLKAHHEELVSSIKDFEKSHADNVKRITETKGEKAVVNYDKQQVEKLKADGARRAKAGDFAGANKSLEQAQHLITVALKQMLQSQTIVYDLKFKSPKEEYEYELKRYGGYEELIPVAIEAKKPTQGAIKLMHSYLDKSHKMRDEAKKKAASGEYPVAIRMMQDATKTVRLALRMVGVMQ